MGTLLLCNHYMAEKKKKILSVSRVCNELIKIMTFESLAFHLN